MGSRKPGPLKKWLKGTRMFHRRKLAQVDSEGVILELDPKRGKAKVLFRNPAVVPDHNGVPWGHDKLLLNKTGLRELFVIDRASGKVERRIALPGNWLRGLHPLDDRRVMVGTGPTAIHLVDVPSGKVLKSMSISQDPNESVHGLYVFPE